MGVVAFNPQAAPATSWPIPGDAPSLRIIVQDQAKTIAAQFALAAAYQGNLNNAQNPPSGAAATGTGLTAGSSTSVTITNASGTIVTGATVTDGSLVPVGTQVLAQASGAVGGNGTYLMSNAINLTTATILTFTPPASGPSPWPIPTDAPTLMTIHQTETALVRTLAALLQHYQDLLNQSQVAPPATGP